MAIEFRCSQCNKLLRTGDDTAGKQAKCPECGTIMPIPAATVAPGDAPQPVQPTDLNAPDQPTSPFAPDGSAQPQSVVAPAPLDFGEVFSRTWNIFKERWGECLVAVVVVWGINVGVNIGVTLGESIVRAVMQDEFAAILFSFVMSVAGTLLSIWLGIGQAKYFLKVARGQAVEIDELFTGGPHFVGVLLASILVGLIVFCGLFLCIVPGVIFALMFSQYYYLVIDRRVPVLESLSQSKELMQGNKAMLFLIGLAMSGLMLLACIPCFLGLLVAVPFATLLNAIVYLTVTGQPMATPAPVATTD